MLGTTKNGHEKNVVPVDLSINLKEDGNKASFSFINGPGVGYVDMDDVQYLFVSYLRCDIGVSVAFQGSSANGVGGDSGQGRRTESGYQYNIPMLLKACG
ncbi:hypothetical protein DPMN_068119 [Dreissena polymorpha]|uniref:Uncharacterized protein n=1 Tax=Dreissena polymorpha TaxID=45954 RepID=A0A9D4BU17_DREPO|nr:hypothetical protein DPMN_068119 [Dreissena polymorpha]